MGAYKMKGTRVEPGAAMPNPKDLQTGADSGSSPKKSNITAESKENHATYSKTEVEPKTRKTTGEA